MVKGKKKAKSEPTFTPDPNIAIWVGFYAEPMTWRLPKLPPVIMYVPAQGADVDGHHLERIKIRLAPGDTGLVGFGVLVARLHSKPNFAALAEGRPSRSEEYREAERKSLESAEALVPTVAAIFERLGIPGTVEVCRTMCS